MAPVFYPPSQRLRFNELCVGGCEVADYMPDSDDFATSERPDWLRALARRASGASEKAAGTEDRPHRAPRVRTLIRAVIGAQGRPVVDAIVRNVSPGGMCIASRTLLPNTGEMLRVSLPGQVDLEAQVRWVGKGEFGVLLTGGSLDVDRLQATNRQRNAGFTAALERLLGVQPQTMRGTASSIAL